MVAIPAKAKEWFLRLYEVPFVALVVWFSWKIRLAPLGSLSAPGHVYWVGGSDAYYHFRVILATVANFPRTLRYDPFTHYPNGTGTGQFGSLFDQGAAGLAILLGKTDPAGVAEVASWYPALLGALAFIPFYFLARRLLGRIGAAFATTALALLPGEFLARSLATSTDHHVAEALGMLLATLGAFNAIEVAAARSHVLSWPPKWRALAWPLASVALGALGIAFYFLVWPPAILIVGVFGIVLAIAMAYEHVRGADTWYLAFGGAGPFLLAGFLLLPTVETTQLNFNTFSLFQPLACFFLAAVLIAFHFASQALLRARAHRAILPTSGVALGIAGFLGVKLAAPGLYGSILWGMSWITGIGVKREILTIAEAQTATYEMLTRDYALLLPAFIVALVALAIAVVVRRRRGDLLLLVWGLLMYTAARTQVRFNYYLALVVALAFGWLVYMVADLTGLNRALAAWFAPNDRATEGATKARGRRTRAIATDERTARPWQFAAVGAVTLLMLPSLVIPETNDNGERATKCIGGVDILPAWVYPTCFTQPRDSDVLWGKALDWMRVSTPDAGVRLTELPDRPPAGQFYDYPDGAYGVLTWWDYGHQIELEGERPPVANPFQQAASFASCYFMATSEDRAEGMLREWSARSFDRTAENLACDRVTVDPAEGEPVHPVRYVMIDDEMAAGKFHALTVWAKYGDYANNEDCKDFTNVDTGEKIRLPFVGDGYYRTMLARLYRDDARDLQHYRLVHETAESTVVGSAVRLDDDLRPFSQCSGVRGQITAFNDAFSRQNRSDPSIFSSLTRNDFVSTGGGSEYVYDAEVEASVKTFEHVKGARLFGTAAPDAMVRVAIPLKSDTTRRDFTWESSTRAGPDGRFALTVPYATTGYVGPAEGGTSYAVRATGPAFVYVGELRSPASAAEVQVPDRAVLDGTEIPVTLG